MCTNVALVDRLECYMDELVGNFEDFVKKSLIIITIAVGGVIAVLLYAIKVINDRQMETIPSRYSTQLRPSKTTSKMGKCSKNCKSSIVLQTSRSNPKNDKFANTDPITRDPSNDETIMSSVALSPCSKSCPSSSKTLVKKVSAARLTIPSLPSSYIDHASKEYISSWYAYRHLTFLLERSKSRCEMDTKELQDESSNSTTGHSEDEVDTPSVTDIIITEFSDENADSVKVEPVGEELQYSDDRTENFEYMHTNKEVNTTISPNKIFKQLPQKKRNYDSDVRMRNTSIVTHSPAAIAASQVPDRISASDDSGTYANFIATKLRLYSQRTKNALQYHISNLLYKADNGYFEVYEPSFVCSSRKNTKSVRDASQSPGLTEGRYKKTSQQRSIVNESNQPTFNDIDLADASLSHEEDIPE